MRFEKGPQFKRDESIPEDRCNCPNPKCNGELTMTQREHNLWQCEKCGAYSEWSWTR